jgi:hypothetical protein
MAGEVGQGRQAVVVTPDSTVMKLYKALKTSPCRCRSKRFAWPFTTDEWECNRCTALREFDSIVQAPFKEKEKGRE